MKNTILVLMCFFLTNSIIAQYNIFPLKERYDDLYSYYVPSVPNYTNCDFTGNSISWTLSGLLRMYQSTGDKAYLVKFVNQCIYLQKNRWDERIPGTDAAWVQDREYNNPNDYCDGDANGGEPSYFNSLIIYPMAEFVNIIVNQPGQTLYNTNLPIQPYLSQNYIDITTLNTMSPGTMITYGNFAMWLGKRVEQTIFFLNASYWMDNSHGVKSHWDDKTPAAMNLQLVPAVALLYIGAANRDFGYGNQSSNHLGRAGVIAAKLKSRVPSRKDNGCPLSPGANCFNFDILRPFANNSYAWYHDGWSGKEDFNFECQDSRIECTDIAQFVEDITHAAMDFFFIRAAYGTGFKPCPTCSPYFGFSETEKFKNTITQNVYYRNGSEIHFRNNVEGGDGNIAVSTVPDGLWAEVLACMPLQVVDGGSAPKLYDILLEHCVNLMKNTVPSSYPPAPNGYDKLGGAQSFQGLSEVVKAQWEHENIGLTLFNRDVVYSQDFIVKGNIVVAPQQDFTISNINYYTAGVTDPFAEPKTFMGGGSKNRFVVESGTTVNMVSAVSVELNAGFEVGLGAAFTGNVQ